MAPSRLLRLAVSLNVMARNSLRNFPRRMQFWASMTTQILAPASALLLRERSWRLTRQVIDENSCHLLQWIDQRQAPCCRGMGIAHVYIPDRSSP